MAWLRDFCKENPADAGVVAAFGQILPQAVLDLPRLGCLNVHTSLLPKYRGAAPIEAAILAGEAETGVTVMQMDAGMDTGDQIYQTEVPILEEDTAETLQTRLAEAAGVLTKRVLEELSEGRELPRTKQDDSLATKAPMLVKEDGLIRWDRPMEEVYNQVRGLYPWPGTYTFWKQDKLLVWSAAKTDIPAEGCVPGTVRTTKKQMFAACADRFLELKEVQLQGKKRMEAAAFLLGNHPEGDILHE